MTHYDGQNLMTTKEPLFFREDEKGYRATEANLFNIYNQVRYQEIIGFGGAITQASAVNLMRMSEKDQETVMRGYFDKEEGLGYSLCRTTINSCDFSAETYSYDDT